MGVYYSFLVSPKIINSFRNVENVENYAISEGIQGSASITGKMDLLWWELVWILNRGVVRWSQI